MKSEYTIDIPWADCSTWAPGKWYPMPLSDMSDQVPLHLWICDGWGIFWQDPETPVDMDGALCGDQCLTFSQALKICEAHNGECFDIEALAFKAAAKKIQDARIAERNNVDPVQELSGLEIDGL